MGSYVIHGDFGVTNEQVIINAINDLNAGLDTKIAISHNSGGNAQLAIDLSSAILASPAVKIDVSIVAFAASAAGFVVMSLQLFGGGKVNLDYTEPCMIMFHRPRVSNDETGLAYFDLPSAICIEYDKLMYQWKDSYQVSVNDLKAYYSNHEYVFILQ